MKLEYLPLLQLQYDLYQLPRGFERFQEYLGAMIDANTDDIKLPLMVMNPMGKEHLSPFLEKLLAMKADAVAAEATREAQVKLQSEPGEYKVCLVVSDDLKGGWTNRYASEFSHRFQQQAYYKRGWIAGILWTSEEYTPELIREEASTCVFRAAHIQRRGYARTLGEMLTQEGYAMHHAGATTPQFGADDLAYTREALAPYLSHTDQATLIAALFGDAAARQLGYPALGLSPRAGLTLALENAKTPV